MYMQNLPASSPCPTLELIEVVSVHHASRSSVANSQYKQFSDSVCYIEDTAYHHPTDYSQTSNFRQPENLTLFWSDKAIPVTESSHKYSGYLGHWSCLRVGDVYFHNYNCGISFCILVQKELVLTFDRFYELHWEEYVAVNRPLYEFKNSSRIGNLCYRSAGTISLTIYVKETLSSPTRVVTSTAIPARPARNETTLYLKPRKLGITNKPIITIEDEYE